MANQTVASELDPSWKTTIITSLSGGLNTSTPPDIIAPEETTTLTNLSLREGRVRIDVGSRLLGNDNSSMGPIRAITIWETAGGKITIAITDRTVEQLVTLTATGTSEWQYADSSTITGYKEADIYEAVTAGATQIKVDAETAGLFVVGEYIGITLDAYSSTSYDGEQWQSKITVISDAGSYRLVTLKRAIPGTSGTMVSINNKVKTALVLNGSVDKSVSTVSVPWAPSGPWIAFTNGVDKPMYYDGTGVKEIPNLTYSGNVICEVMATYKGTLILGNCTLGGDRARNTILWSDIGDPTDWSSNNSGEQGIFEEGEEITAMRSLGPDMIVYGPRSVIRMTFIGSTNFLFGFAGAISGSSIGGTTLGQGIGCVSSQAIFSTGDSHIFMSPNGIFVYRGGYSATLISGPIHNDYFGSGGFINPSTIHRTFTVFSAVDRELYFYSPQTGTGTYTDKALVLSIDSVGPQGSGKPIFRTREYPTFITGAGHSVTQSALTWSGVTSLWIDTLFTWNSDVLESDTPIVVLGSSGTTGVSEVRLVIYTSGSENRITVLPITDIDKFIAAGAGTDIDLPKIDGTTLRTTIEDFPTATSFSPPAADCVTSADSVVDGWLVGGTIYIYGDNFAAFQVDALSSQDMIDSAGDGSDICWELVTKDFSTFDKEIRTDMLDVAIQNWGAHLYISRDGGNTYRRISGLTNTVIGNRVRRHFQGVSDMFRLKFIGDGGNAEIGSLAIRYREEDKYRLT